MQMICTDMGPIASVGCCIREVVRFQEGPRGPLCCLYSTFSDLGDQEWPLERVPSMVPGAREPSNPMKPTQVAWAFTAIVIASNQLNKSFLAQFQTALSYLYPTSIFHIQSFDLSY